MDLSIEKLIVDAFSCTFLPSETHNWSFGKNRSYYLKEAFFLKIRSPFWTSRESIFLENSSQSIEDTCVSHQYERSSVKSNRIREFVSVLGFFQGNPSETSTNSSANYQQYGNRPDEITEAGFTIWKTHSNSYTQLLLLISELMERHSLYPFSRICELLTSSLI